mmetsp:Transcript_115553/g.246933  ORF Transcript_115553/g.246933 Transcript_115553/m.246933 type:complete len:96 (+) Transcript_115553:105-392(+)
MSAAPPRTKGGPPAGWTASKASTSYNKFIESKAPPEGIRDHGGEGGGGGGPSLPFRIIDWRTKPCPLGANMQYCMTRARTDGGNKIDVLEFEPHC